MRILVTGSRYWLVDDLYEIGAVLLEHGLDGDSSVTLIHGACPRGVDKMADAFAHEFGWTVERHPANWETYGRRAGYVRNAEMVKAGADICLAFIRNESKGATMCANLAEEAGIKTVRIRK